MVIIPEVDLQVLSAFWIMRAGQKYEAVLNSNVAFGNRLRRKRSEDVEHLGKRLLNLDCVGLFAPYFGAYRRWRSKGLQVMRESLEKGMGIHAITMDIQQFYHRTSPKFLLRDEFLSRVGVVLDEDDRKLTALLLKAMDTWYRSTPDFVKRPEGALPVGLSASKIISNVLLAEFDEKIISKLEPLYYGRYVDDIFLVLKASPEVNNASALVRQLAARVGELLKIKKSDDSPQLGLQVKLGYAKDSQIIFAGSKQKVFHLIGKHGLDLIHQIEAQIRRQSSEHRLLSVLPSKAEDMAARTLLAQASASLEADALRKADIVSVRRLGLALLLRDVEAYERDLNPSGWRKTRHEFYGLVYRHVLTPRGFFEYYAYIHRVFGLMISCGDAAEAIAFLAKLVEVMNLLNATSTASSSAAAQFLSCRYYFAQSLYQVAVQATTVRRFRWTSKVAAVFRGLSQIEPSFRPITSKSALVALATRVLYADWGRRPYRELWLNRVPRALKPPALPSSRSFRRKFRLGAIRRFRRSADLKVPYWPALVFPTRPISLTDISLADPKFLASPAFLRDALFAFRGSRAQDEDGVFTKPSGGQGQPSEVHVANDPKGAYRFALPSILTTEAEWANAANGKPSLGLVRYARLKELINDVLKKAADLDFVIFPECSMPRAWAFAIAYALARRGISMIAGLEYSLTHNGVRNDALLSLATKWPWHATSVLLVQHKFAPAHEEARGLRKLGRKRLFVPRTPDDVPPIYIFGGITFATMICSDLTNISHRTLVQGKVDALVVLEWNRDLDTFGSLIEATASDLHAYVVQSNNRLYGDSRIRAPRKQRFERDLVRVRGGLDDYFVVAEIDIEALRKFQTVTPKTANGPFKPVPIGFRLAEQRKYEK